MENNPEVSGPVGIASFKTRLVVVEAVSDGKRDTVLVFFENDGTMVIADADPDSEMPAFVDRRVLDAFPTDELVLQAISSVLGGERRLVSIADRGIELDKSALAGLKKMPVDIFDDVYLGEVHQNALVLCVDVRNFSDFLCANKEEDVFRLIKDFTSNLLSCVNQFGYGCSYYKLMGDGAIVIWDETNEENIAEALLVFDSYIDFVNEELFKSFPGLGLAGALVADQLFKYEISAEASQLKYRDYVGYGINLACRLQALARKDQLVVNRALSRTGLVPFKASDSLDSRSELHSLKGLKREDRELVLLYAPAGRS